MQVKAPGAILHIVVQRVPQATGRCDLVMTHVTGKNTFPVCVKKCYLILINSTSHDHKYQNSKQSSLQKQ